MIGKILTVTWDESKKGVGGWEFVSANKSRWQDFNFEESSIDLAITACPRIIVDDVEYDVHKQYFIKDSDTQTTRLMLLYPMKRPVKVVEEDEPATTSDTEEETGNDGTESNTSETITFTPDPVSGETQSYN